ncbi:MAG: CheR family methyltransferase, partial [Bacteroidota bacterium]
FYMVGIGASAGGYDALKAFFSAIPPKPGLAFVIIQHLSRDHKSFTQEWLTKLTSLPITSVEKDTVVEPDHIYLMPESKLLKIADKTLIVEAREDRQQPNFAIDVFLHSLAGSLKEKAIGIILSGTGTDGSRGIRSIKENGGIVLVQQPDTANFDGMPSMAIASDHPDMILPPVQLAEGLLAYVANPASIPEEVWQDPTASDKEMVQEIIEHVSHYSKVDFRTYKINTILRRIEKRTKLNHLYSLVDYHQYTKRHPEEIQLLYQDLLIGVTQFFRDAPAFEALKEKVIPRLFHERKSYDAVRIWVAGCSTGEEAYSLAIICEEYLQAQAIDIPFKIFATDLDTKSIEMASIGRYRNDIEADVSQERLDKYFTQLDDFYEIKKSLRKKIIFARHNLISDPPFLKLDLLTCRNVFIYLKSELQKRLLDNFSYALKPQAFLLLGANETYSGIDSPFEPLDTQWKIYTNRPNTIRKSQVFEADPVVSPPYSAQRRQAKDTRHRSISSEEADYEALIFEEYVPACIFINTDNEMIYSHGAVEKYLQFPKKRTNFEIFNLVGSQLSAIFKNGLRRIRNGESRVMFREVAIARQDTSVRVDIHFKEVRKMAKVQALVLVEFQDSVLSAENTPAEVVVADDFSQHALQELEMELKLTKKELLFTVDELEMLNEEMQASNEEMHSSNEELQSTNEEMQSANEELYSVNIELQQKIDEVMTLHNDMTNLVNNTEIAIVFLDEELRIRKFTLAAKANFNFLESDLGRPLSHLTNNLLYDSLLEDTKQILLGHEPIEKEVEDRNGQVYLTRLLPYKTDNRLIKGVVVIFINITPIKQVTLSLQKRTQELEESEQGWRTLVNNTPDSIARYDANLAYTSVNAALEKKLGLSADQIIGRTNRDLGIPPDSERVNEWMELLSSVFRTGESQNTFFEYAHQGSNRHYYASLVPEFSADGTKVESVLSISRDITQLKAHEQVIESQNRQLKRTNTDLDDFIYTASHDLRAPISTLEGILTRLVQRLDGKADDTEHFLLDMTMGTINKLKKTINDLTHIVKVQNALGEPEEAVVFQEVWEEVKADLDTEVIESEAIISTQFDVSALAYPRKHLRSILHNLLSNALKYKPLDQPPQVHISTQDLDGVVRLTFTDNGLGMTPSQLEKLFLMFKRFHTHVEGTGIGLYTVKRLIENNGGSIQVESEEKKGTTFLIDLTKNTLSHGLS